MKNFYSLFVAGLLMCVLAGCTSNHSPSAELTTLEEETNSNTNTILDESSINSLSSDSDDTYTYTNRDYDFTIDLPKIYEETKVEKEVLENEVTRYTFVYETTDDMWPRDYAPALVIQVIPLEIWEEMIKEGRYTYDQEIQTLDDKVLALGSIQDTASDISQFLAPLDPEMNLKGITEYINIHSTISP